MEKEYLSKCLKFLFGFSAQCIINLNTFFFFSVLFTKCLAVCFSHLHIGSQAIQCYTRVLCVVYIHSLKNLLNALSFPFHQYVIQWRKKKCQSNFRYGSNSFLYLKSTSNSHVKIKICLFTNAVRQKFIYIVIFINKSIECNSAKHQQYGKSYALAIQTGLSNEVKIKYKVCCLTKLFVSSLSLFINSVRKCS